MDSSASSPAKARGRCGRTIKLLDAPLNHSPDVPCEEVTVCDPTHPLYGRTFKVHFRSLRLGAEPIIQVVLREGRLLRLPISALAPPWEPGTKLNLSAVAELVTVFGALAPPLCPSVLSPSGPPSRLPSDR